MASVPGLGWQPVPSNAAPMPVTRKRRRADDVGGVGLMERSFSRRCRECSDGGWTHGCVVGNSEYQRENGLTIFLAQMPTLGYWNP